MWSAIIFQGKSDLVGTFSVLRRGSVSAAVPLALYPGFCWRPGYEAVPPALVASSTSEQEVHSALEQLACFRSKYPAKTTFVGLTMMYGM